MLATLTRTPFFPPLYSPPWLLIPWRKRSAALEDPFPHGRSAEGTSLPPRRSIAVPTVLLPLGRRVLPVAFSPPLPFPHLCPLLPAPSVPPPPPRAFSDCNLSLLVPRCPVKFHEVRRAGAREMTIYSPRSAAVRERGKDVPSGVYDNVALGAGTRAGDPALGRPPLLHPTPRDLCAR